MEQSRRKGWSLVALDLGVDTTTPAGEALASTLAVFAQFERRLIGERTNALAVKKSQGVTLGRPRSLPDKVRTRIHQIHRSGESLSAIARQLTNEGVPTAHGGKRWYASTVKSMLRRTDV
jgi:DNA invertase Pin-like site-specific DNA recombinase